MLNVQDLTRLQDLDLVDRDGEKIGSIDDIYVDDDTDEPEFALVHTGLFGTRSHFVPLAEATQSGDTIQVPYDKDQVKDAPSLDADGELSQSEEEELYRHYGLLYSKSRSDSGLPEGAAGTTTGGAAEVRDRDALGRDPCGPATDDAMTRSEEELRVDTTAAETGRARLRKYVVTEDVQTTAPVQREEVRIEREPITDANVDRATTGPDLSEDEHEVTLRAEEHVIEKRVVPKARGRLEKDTYTEQQSVSEELRRERVAAEGDLDDPNRRG